MPSHTTSERKKKKKAGNRGFFEKLFLSNPNRMKGRLREQGETRRRKAEEEERKKGKR